MRVLMFLHLPFPPDDRVRQEALSLIKKGHEVKIICARRECEPETELIDGIEVIRLRRWPIYLFEALVILRALMLHRKWRFDVFHKHDLPMALTTALALKKLLGVRVVLDLHENWTAMIESTLPKVTRFQRLIINTLKKEEKLLLTHADRIIVVTEEHIERLERLSPGVRGRCWVVHNYANIPKIRSAILTAMEEERSGRLPPVVKRALAFMKSKKTNIVYFGGLGRHRGVETLIEALPLLPDNVGGVVAGGNPERDYIRDLRHRAEVEGVEDRVFFTGHLEFRHGMLIVKRGDICLIPYLSNPHTETTLPHKIFQYMYLEKPVIASAVAPVKRIITASGAGLCFTPGDHNDLANAVSSLIKDPTMGEEMGHKGKIAVERRYNWDESAKHLIDLYSSFR